MGILIIHYMHIFQGQIHLWAADDLHIGIGRTGIAFQRHLQAAVDFEDGIVPLQTDVIGSVRGDGKVRGRGGAGMETQHHDAHH